MISEPVHIYTDGSCSPNPGPGGWAAVLLFDKGSRVVEIHGAALQSTNNRMELTATVEALASLAESSDVELYTDSRYVRDGMTKWLATWQKREWQTIDGGEVKNRDLWEKLILLIEQHRVQWHWVKGHDDNTWNNRADVLALEARKTIVAENREEQHTEEGVPGRSRQPPCVQLYPAVTWRNSTGTGSWSVILHFDGHYKILGGKEEQTTANRLYLQAIRHGLEALTRPVPVQIHTKSGYIRDGLTHEKYPLRSERRETIGAAATLLILVLSRPRVPR